MSALTVPPPVVPWRGHVLASGLWFSGPDVDQARVLGEWSDECAVRELEGGILLSWSRPRRMDVATAPGLVLVDQGGALLGGPAPAQAGEVVLPRHGALVRARLVDLPRVDPADWLDVHGLPVHAVRPLGPPPASRALPLALAITPADARTLLGRPAATPEQQAFLEELRAAGNASAVGAVGGRAGWIGPGGAPSGPPSPLLLALGGLFAVFGAIFGGGSPSLTGPTTRPAPIHDSTPPPLAPPSPWVEWLRRLAAPLWRPLRAPAYEQQLRRLFDLFDEGDLDEALRWAIPLDKDGKPSGAAPGWELPKPRDRFDIVGRPAGGRFGLGLATEPFMELRQRYERAHERLLAQGRIDDAAFVLAELLREPGRAVDLLEKEKRWEQAAKVAVAAELPPERIVRLWMRAGDLPRALLWARRTGAFGAALAALTKDQPEEARILRQAWARHFAERGDFAGATTVAWEDPRLRAEAVPWLGAALASGTPAGAALLARVLRQDAATYAMVADRLEGLLAVPGLEGIRLRQALGRGLAAEGGAHGRRLLRPVVRALLGDLSRTPELVDVGWLRGVVPMVDDRALARDVPTLSAARQTLIGRPQPIRVEVAAGDVGTAEVYDLAWLPNGGVLVALGELGCRSYAADGRVRARFDVAATALVPLAGSTRSLALALRAWGVRVSRLDVADASVNEWLDRPLTAWSTAADGNQWFVAEASHVLALDLLANPPQALWRVECDGPVHRITAGEQALAILADAGEERERWRYRLPDLRLLERLRSGPPDSGREALLASGALLQLRGGRPGQALSMVTTAERPVDERVSILLGDDQTGEAAQAPHACGEWRAWVRSYAYGARVHLAHASVHTVVLTVHLAGARRVVLRLDAAVLAIGDDRGRVLVFDLETGVCLRDLRVG